VAESLSIAGLSCAPLSPRLLRHTPRAEFAKWHPLLHDQTMYSDDLCAPCQAAFRHGRASGITGPKDQRKGKYVTRPWACALCVAIRDSRDMGRSTIQDLRLITRAKSQAKVALISLNSALKNVTPSIYPFSNLNRTTQASSTVPVPPICDLADVLLVAPYLLQSSYQSPVVSEKTSECPFQSVQTLRIVPKRQIDRLLVNHWLSHCETAHSVCASQKREGSLTVILIDVKRKCLVSTTAARYFALSYVWGGVSQLLLMESNFIKLQQDGALGDRCKEIAPVLKDAMAFVESLSEQYLWVDTLCIIQDSPDRSVYLSQMDQIYHGAVCTLVAVDGIDAMSSLPGVRPDTRVLNHLDKTANLGLVRKRTDLAHVFRRSIYDSRAWTFQEHILSQRCLYFTNEMLYFQCHQVVWSEDQFESREQHFCSDGVHTSLQWIGQRRSLPWVDKFQAYTQLVKQYSGKLLSYLCDRLNAFLGISSGLEREWGWGFAAGLPMPLFDRALLWIPTMKTAQRIVVDEPKQYLPSWSWVGWSDGIHYPITFSAMRTLVIERLAITSTEGMTIFQVSIGNELLPSMRVAKLITNAPVAETDDLHGLCCVPPQLRDISNLLIFWTETLPSNSYPMKRIANPKITRMFDATISSLFVYRLLGRRGEVGLLTCSEELPSELDESYQYVLIRSDGFVIYIMLTRDTAKGYAERVAIGDMDEDAWIGVGSTRKRICLG
jgi:hypothetical protein